MRITDWDDAYQNAAYISDAEAIAAGWAERSASFREANRAEIVPYGDGPRQFIDLYHPPGPADGLTIVVHGGYWHKFDGRTFAHLAAGPLAAGQAVAVVTYALAPDARIRDITDGLAKAVTLLAARVDGPIRLTGHSAGGHLVTRMVCSGVLPGPVAARIAHVLSISGVHDLRPLLRTQMNAVLDLDATEAVEESPALLVPLDTVAVTCVVGSAERPEFLRQTDLLANIWTGLGVETRCVHLEGENHFTIVAGLESPEGPLTRLLLDQ